MENDNYELDDTPIIILKNKKGTDEEFYLIAQFDYMDNWYVAVEPVKKTEEIKEGDLIFMKISQDNDGNDIFLPIKDAKLGSEVFAEFLNVKNLYDKE